MRWRIALLAASLFRLGCGLTADFWTEDERQVFLIGLRSYARGEWPFFGADVVWTDSSGAIVRTGTVVLKEILQPGERRTWDRVVDGLAAPDAVGGTLRALTAEKCVPARLAGVGLPAG